MLKCKLVDTPEALGTETHCGKRTEMCYSPLNSEDQGMARGKSVGLAGPDIETCYDLRAGSHHSPRYSLG